MGSKRVTNLDECVEMLAGETHPKQLMEGALRMMSRVTRASRAGVWTLVEGTPKLEASWRIDYFGLDLVPRLWGARSGSLAEDDVIQEQAQRPDAAAVKVSYVVIPVCDAPCEFVALVYLEIEQQGIHLEPVLDKLRQLSRLVRKATRMPLTARLGPFTEASWESYLAETPGEEIERQRMLLLLNRNEWNIARVARLMHMTRRTIYRKLQRYGIERQHVPKLRVRSGLLPSNG